MHGKVDLIMTINMRRLIVVAPIATILLVANILNLGEWLDGVGAIGWARTVSMKYITGTAITIIAVLITLLPSGAEKTRRISRPRNHCPVCDEETRPGGQYCPACGSRV